MSKRARNAYIVLDDSLMCGESFREAVLFLTFPVKISDGQSKGKEQSPTILPPRPGDRYPRMTPKTRFGEIIPVSLRQVASASRPPASFAIRTISPSPATHSAGTA